MDKTQEQPKKCFCARCFLPIEEGDKVDIEGQNFHRLCSMCCVCRTIPTSLKMFYGHVFCSECFKTHVLARFRGEAPRMHSSSWWMQFAPGAKPHDGKDSNATDGSKDSSNPPEEPAKRCICARCLQAVQDNNKVDIGGQSFHTQCARCYFCHSVPKNSVKIYYGQVFCEDCFHKFVLNRGRDNPNEFFKNCFEQWQNNSQFAENMRDFMAGNKDATPFVFMMNGGQPPFCRCGNGPQEWAQPNEPRKSATPARSVGGDSFGTWDLSFENRTDASDALESNESASENAAAAEKIEKLTKYLRPPEVREWRGAEVARSWRGRGAEVARSRRGSGAECPQCLWQCGVVRARPVCCGDC